MLVASVSYSICSNLSFRTAINCNFRLNRLVWEEDMIRYLIGVLVLIFAFCILSSHPVRALTMSDSIYQLDSQSLDDATDLLSRPTKPLRTAREQVLGSATTPTYTLITVPDPISLTLSESLIDYGSLSATNPVIRTLDIAVRKNFGGYELLTQEDHPLLAANAATIPDTSCDNGSCTIDTAANWSNTLTFGFGYRCTDRNGNGCSTEFTNPTYYKRFPKAVKTQIPQIVLSSLFPAQDIRAQILYKVNIAGTQSPGSYSNTVSYIAVPNF